MFVYIICEDCYKLKSICITLPKAFYAVIDNVMSTSNSKSWSAVIEQVRVYFDCVE